MSEENLSQESTPPQQPDTQPVAEVDPVVTEGAEPPSGIDKALQREQFKRANLEKQNQDLMREMAEIKRLLTTPDPDPTPTPAAEIQVEEDLAALESLDPNAAKLLKRLAAKNANPEGLSKKEAQELRDKLAYHEFWSQQPVSYRKAFEEEQARCQNEEGLSGARLEGSMDRWWKQFLREKTSGKAPTAASPTPSTPGADRLVPAGSGVQPRQKMTLDEAIRTGKIHLATATEADLKKFS